MARSSSSRPCHHNDSRNGGCEHDRTYIARTAFWSLKLDVSKSANDSSPLSMLVPTERLGLHKDRPFVLRRDANSQARSLPSTTRKTKRRPA